MSNGNQNTGEQVKQRFQNLFQNFESNLNGASKLKAHSYRKSALDRLNDLDFPTRRDENWKYTSVARLIEPSYQLGLPFKLSQEQLENTIIPDLNGIKLIFTNGVLNAELSDLDNLPEGLTIKKLEEAVNDGAFGTTIETALQGKSADSSNAFVAANNAFARNGIFVHLKAKTVIDQPIYMVYLTDFHADRPIFITPQVVAIVEDQSELSLVEHFSSTSETAYFNNSVNRFHVGKNSHLSHYKIQKEGKEAFQVTNGEVQQERDSTFSAYTIDLGGKIIRNNLSAVLNDSGTMTNMFGVYLPDQGQHIDNQTFMDHAFPHCNSNELYKGVIKGNGRGVFNGKVLVRQDAQKTNAFQQNSSLVLSDKGVMDTKPQLEIYADDVRCSHGATIGQLDESSVYYLRARGLSDSQARALLQFAFVGEVIEKIPLESIRNYVIESVRSKLNS